MGVDGRRSVRHHERAAGSGASRFGPRRLDAAASTTLSVALWTTPADGAVR